MRRNLKTRGKSKSENNNNDNSKEREREREREKTKKPLFLEAFPDWPAHHTNDALLLE